MHVMWLDGQGVHAPWPSPFAPHIRIDCTRPSTPAVRQSGSFIQSVAQPVCSGCSFTLRIAHSVRLLVARAFTVEKQSRAGEKISSRNSRIGEVSVGLLPRDCRGTQSADICRRVARQRSANSAASGEEKTKQMRRRCAFSGVREMRRLRLSAGRSRARPSRCAPCG
jgi:hypothetical protein